MSTFMSCMEEYLGMKCNPMLAASNGMHTSCVVDTNMA